MKNILLILTTVSLVSCTQTAYITKPKKTADIKLKREGKVEFIRYKTGKSSSVKTLQSMNPNVLLADGYIEISYPAKTKIPTRVIPRESLIELRWKK